MLDNTGDGSMLFKSQDERTPKLLQGSFVTSAEITAILENVPEVYDDIEMLEIRFPEISEDLVDSNVTIKKDKQELADILFWTLNRTQISVLQIQKNFKIGNRATEIMDILYKMNIVSAKFSNQPREVIANGLEDLSLETIKLLEDYGYTKAQIEKTLESKK